MNAYRDQLDVLKIKAEKVNKLENEILKYKEKLMEMDVLKKRKEVSYADFQMSRECSCGCS